MPLLDSLPAGSRVLVIRLRSLGDCVLTTPALALLREHRPDLKISVMVEDRFAEIFRRHPAVQCVRPPSPGAALRARPALCLNLHGGTRSQWLMFAAGPFAARAGFGHHAHARFYTHRIPRAQEILGEERTVHTAEHLASAVFWLGVPRQEVPRASLYPAARPAAGATLVIHALASAADKMWRPEKFLAVARALCGQYEPVFIGGPGDDLTPFGEFRTLAAPLDQTMALLSGASLFIGNDSGPAHMAAAFGVPVVVLYGASDPVVWAPWRTAAETFVGLDRVSPEDVLAAAARLGGAVAG